MQTLSLLFEYSDWSNGELMRAATPLRDEDLDRSFDIGRGSLRRTLIHVWAGEDVWLKRWKGVTETPWPNEDELTPMTALAEKMAKTISERRTFVLSKSDADLAELMVYRDSLGSLFEARLGDMFLQGIVHSIHHRAQAVNILRRLGQKPPEVDYMMRVRKPA